MIIKDFFANDINRNIETVIKADDRDHISDEVVEYVITKEIATKIQALFRAYIDYQGVNGVWISGFFGSGKSHLLKILSYVLENKENDGYRCAELFAEKIENDEMLKGDVLATTRIPSESILFNIDQHAQITSKSDANAILSVFYKVFFDHLGYYGFQPHVAEFEMWLDRQGKYKNFKNLFETNHGKSWEDVRTDYFDPAVTDTIAQTLGAMNGHHPSKYENILDEIEDRQKHSIEDFCNRVYEYIKSRQTGFRLNFFVDEVGQYISGDTRLMLNMQTLAETLATRTKGQSWIFVTSQEDMEKVVGDMSKSQQNDFSKIQARFKLKIPLTSANVDEVIEKRLLKKNEASVPLLKNLWRQESANLDTLMTFSDVGLQLRKYKDEGDFINKYPFVAYQFNLLQECRRALSSHNAFQGKHQSVGERSMLGVFQQVVKGIETKDIRTLVSFDQMFEGIRNELRGEIQKSIILAENNLDNRFAVQILKTLFMVKYFKNFKTTTRNIIVLMIDDVNINLKHHEKKVSEALNILENQNYLQRNGDLYEFLTDDEKDIEESIKATDIDDQAISNMLKELFFDEIIRDNKLRFIDNKQDYDFAPRIDGVMIGRDKELTIEIITTNHPEYENTLFHQAQTMGSSCMKLVLPADTFFVRDLKLFLRTNRYIKLNQSTSTRQEIKRILQDKASLNAERRRNLIALAGKLLATAIVYMNGSKHELGQTADGRSRVQLAFQDLIRIVYPSLRMIGTTLYSEDTIRITLRKSYDELFHNNEISLSEAETELIGHIKRRSNQSERTSLNDISINFNHKPYGWYDNAIWTLVGRLFKRNFIELRQESNLLSDEEALNALLNSKHHHNTLIVPKSEENPDDIKKLRELYAELFDETVSLSTGKEVGNVFKEKLREMLIEIEKLLVSRNDYPFLAALEPLSDRLDKLINKDYAYFLANRKDFEDDLLKGKEDLLDPIRKFWNGEQKSIFDSIRIVLTGDTSNLEYIEGDELQIMQNTFRHATPFLGSLIRDAKAAMDELKRKVKTRIEEERMQAIAFVEKALAELEGMDEYAKLSEPDKKVLHQPFAEEIAKLEKQRYIANIMNAKNMVLSTLLPKQLNQMIRLATPEDTGDPGVVSEPVAHYINRSSVKISFTKTELRTEDDVDDYAEALKNALKEEIKKNRRIKL
ncbi:MAG: BREX system P-loop protein BrxC [Bacteroidales bacterium]|nr:BREX system P-loop protein BrxC [Bacteroidales bacterium]